MKIDGVSTSIDTSQYTANQTKDDKSTARMDGSYQNQSKSENISGTNQNNKYTKDEMSISDKTLQDAIEKANKAIEGPDKRFQFSIHKGTHEIVVKVINNDTGEVIKEFPSEKILDMVAKMWQMAGIMVDERR